MASKQKYLAPSSFSPLHLLFSLSLWLWELLFVSCHRPFRPRSLTCKFRNVLLVRFKASGRNPSHALQQVIDGADTGECQLKALDVCRGGNRVCSSGHCLPHYASRNPTMCFKDQKLPTTEQQIPVQLEGSEELDSMLAIKELQHKHTMET